MLCNWGYISYVKSRAMALNLVEYKSPVQNVIAYARIACLLFVDAVNLESITMVRNGFFPPTSRFIAIGRIFRIKRNLV